MWFFTISGLILFIVGGSASTDKTTVLTTTAIYDQMDDSTGVYDVDVGNASDVPEMVTEPAA